MAQLRYSSFSIPPTSVQKPHIFNSTPRLPSMSLFSPSRSLSLLHTRSSSSSSSSIPLFDSGNNNNNNNSNNNNNNGKGFGGGGGKSNNNEKGDSEGRESRPSNLPIIGSFINGWRSRVAADPQFAFKVLMEELVGVSACVLGDMASRPNFGLNELDFVFSTLVVGAIVNFVLMYLLAPTVAAQNSPFFFPNSPQSHMFEPGAYSLFDRAGTFLYKGAVFAAVGFAAGLVGTAISNGLIQVRKKMDPEFETPNKPPPTLLNALTWAIQMGLSSNFRYQTLNGIEFLLAKGLPPAGFKASVVVLRALNNVLGGVSFVMLARLTGSQKVEQSTTTAVGSGSEDEKEKLVRDGEELQSTQSQCK